MADDGPVTGEGEALRASVGEQLREKAELDRAAGEEREAAAAREAAIERHKDAERSELTRHGVAPSSWPTVRQAARRARGARRPGLAALALVVAGVALATRWLARRRR